MTKWMRYIESVTGRDTYAEIAAKIGAAPSTVSRWMSGAIEPKPRQAVALARAYGSSPLVALIAADYLTPDEVDIAHVDPSMDDFTTLDMVSEIRRRLSEAAGVAELFGWNTASGTVTDATRGKYFNPKLAPSSADIVIAAASPDEMSRARFDVSSDLETMPEEEIRSRYAVAADTSEDTTDLDLRTP